MNGNDKQPAQPATTTVAAQEAEAWQRRYKNHDEWFNISKHTYAETVGGKWAEKYDVRELYATPAAPGIDLATAIRNCCEAEKADPDHPDTICISVNDLAAIMQQCVMDASPKGDSDERARFEAWAAGFSYQASNLDTTRHASVADWYESPITAFAWVCWRAALQATSAEVGS